MPFQRGRDIASIYFILLNYKDLSKFPDGALTFYEASPTNLTYKI